MGKRWMVLGGGGSFGLHTSKYILEKCDPEKVIGVGRNVPKLDCFNLGIGDRDPRYSYHSYHVYYEQDLLLELMDKVKPHIIVNYAAQGEGAASWKNSWRFFETNCVALAKLTEALGKRDWLERFIHIGTSEMYGSVEKPANEDTPIKPSSPYAASKVAFDMHLLSIHKYLKFPMNVIRPSNAYGPGQQLHRVIPKAIVCGLTGEKLPLQGGGRSEKSYIHNKDVARAVVAVAAKRRSASFTMPAPRNRPPSARSSNCAPRPWACHSISSVRSRKIALDRMAGIGSIARGSTRTAVGSRRYPGKRAWPTWSPGARGICRPCVRFPRTS